MDFEYRSLFSRHIQCSNKTMHFNQNVVSCPESRRPIQHSQPYEFLISSSPHPPLPIFVLTLIIEADADDDDHTYIHTTLTKTLNLA